MVVPWWASSGASGQSKSGWARTDSCWATEQGPQEAILKELSRHEQTAAEESGLGAPEPCREVFPPQPTVLVQREEQ